MSLIAENIFNEVLSLPVDARVSLVEKLIVSLNLPTQEEIDHLWAKEAERRIDEIRKGKATLISGEEVFAKIQKKYRS